MLAQNCRISNLFMATPCTSWLRRGEGGSHAWVLIIGPFVYGLDSRDALGSEQAKG